MSNEKTSREETWVLLRQTGAGLIVSVGLMLLDGFYLNLLGFALAVLTSFAFLRKAASKGH